MAHLFGDESTIFGNPQAFCQNLVKILETAVPRKLRSEGQSPEMWLRSQTKNDVLQLALEHRISIEQLVPMREIRNDEIPAMELLLRKHKFHSVNSRGEKTSFLTSIHQLLQQLALDYFCKRPEPIDLASIDIPAKGNLIESLVQELEELTALTAARSA